MTEHSSAIREPRPGADWASEDWVDDDCSEPEVAPALAMVRPAAFLDPSAEDGADGGYDDSSSEALFDGDDGGLDLMQRRALVVLIKQRFLSEQKHAPEFQALVQNPRPIRSRLNDLFMDLVLDVERGVAYKRQVHPEGGGRFPTLLHDSPWGREETVVLVYLRSRYRHETAAGNGRAFVDRDGIIEFVDHHRPAHATDRTSDLRRANSAIESLCTAGLLIGRKDGARFEINRAIEVLLPIEKLRLLLTWLQDANRGITDTGPAPAPETALPPVADSGPGHTSRDDAGSHHTPDNGTDDGTDDPSGDRGSGHHEEERM